ncbi:intron Large complex component GCFC2 [Synchiropus picturatus]
MFKKSTRRNFRQRKDDSSEDEDKKNECVDESSADHDTVPVNKPSKVTSGRGISCSSKREVVQLQSQCQVEEDGEHLEETAEKDEERPERDSTKKKSNAVLSFSDDKEVSAQEPEFKLKKTSDKAVLFQARKKQTPPVTTTQKTGSGVLPLDSPKEVDENRDSSYEVLSSADEDSDDVDTTVAKGTNKWDDDDDDDNDDDDDDDDNDDGNDDNEDDDDDDDNGGNDDVSSPSSNSKSSYSKPVIFPSAKQIEAAKRQRRDIRAQKDFIPVSTRKTDNSSASSTPSRYNLEEAEERDDDDDEPDDHEKRIEFAPRSRTVRERIAETLGESDDSLSGSDRDEQEIWEEIQIEKGVKRRPGEQSPSGSESSWYSSGSRQESQRRHKKKTPFPKTLPSVTVQMVKRRITGKLDSLKEVHRARLADLRRMEGDVENARASAECLEEASPEKQLSFYRSMILYTHNLVECLREKIVDINALELELHNILSGHSEALQSQRQQKIKGQAEKLQQLSYSEEHCLSAQEADGDTVQVSEAKDIPDDTRATPEEEEHLQKQTADILLRAQSVFSDVQEEFCEVKKILSRFEEWRASYSESYHTAYISLCLPKLLNPIIRHQLLAWNPLKDACGDVENLPWFQAVETFCHGHGHEELEHTDRKMLSTTIEKTVLPKITTFVDLVWDPMSEQQSKCLTDLCQRLREDYSIFEGEQSKPVKTFTEAVTSRLRGCVEEDIFIPLYPRKFLEDLLSPQRRFRDQQFWLAVKLLGNLGKWDTVLPEAVLKELMLDKVLNRYLMITLCSQTLTECDLPACKRIADSLPKSWLSDVSEGLPQLQSLKNHLVGKVHAICKQQPSKDPNTRSAVVEVLQVLSRLRCHDSILTLAGKYHYEDAVYSHQLLNQET